MVSSGSSVLLFFFACFIILAIIGFLIGVLVFFLKPSSRYDGEDATTSELQLRKEEVHWEYYKDLNYNEL